MLINDLSARLAAHDSLIRAAIDRVLASGWLVLGPEVRAFEERFANYLGVEHCVSVANGTDALQLALRALGVRAGDRVATVANAGMYSTGAIVANGAEPLFMDVERSSCNVTVDEVRRALTQRPKVVVATHLYGLAVADIAEIAQACNEAGVALLEDCAQAHGARVQGRRVGAFGAAATFSFYPTKNLGALGDGGAVVTSDEGLARELSALRQYGWQAKYEVQREGGRNSRLDELQAAVLSAFLPGLDATNARRRQIAAMYSEAISHRGVVTGPGAGEGYVAHLYVVRTRAREGLRAHLKAQAIASDVHYPICDHRQPVFGNRFEHVRLPVSEALAGEVLTLPCYPEMSDAQVEQVADAVNGWVV